MSIEKIINEAWENKDQVSQNSDKSLKDAVNQIRTLQRVALVATHAKPIQTLISFAWVFG